MLHFINDYLMLGSDTSAIASPWLLAIATAWASAQMMRRQSRH